MIDYVNRDVREPRFRGDELYFKSSNEGSAILNALIQRTELSALFTVIVIMAVTFSQNSDRARSS